MNNMIDVFLISEKTLKEKSYINDNVDACYINPAIQTAQDLGLQPIIGTALYNEIKKRILNDQLDENYEKLLDEYIEPYLIFKVMSDIQIPLAFKQRNAGIIQSNNQYVDNSIMQDAQRLLTYYDQKATFYANRLSDFLKCNTAVFKEYKNCDINKGMRANKDAFNTSIFLD